MAKKYYTQSEVDDYVRKLLTDSEIALSKQAERIESLRNIRKKRSLFQGYLFCLKERPSF